MEVRRMLTGEISQEVSCYDSYAMLPQDSKDNIRNDMHLVSETLQRMDKAGASLFLEEDKAVLKPYKQYLDHATKLIPGWVKVAVALDSGFFNGAQCGTC